MAIEKVREYLKQWNKESEILEFQVSSATVELAAKALNCEGKRIAKTMSFKNGDECILVVTAGDAKINNGKYKDVFQIKARMLSPDEVETMVGHSIGGVCPFGVNEQASVYLDESLKRFHTVFPACGSSNSAIELTIEELEQYSRSKGWVDVCVIKEPEPESESES